MLWECEHPKKTEKQENMKILKPEKNVEITLKLKKKKSFSWKWGQQIPVTKDWWTK